MNKVLAPLAPMQGPILPLFVATKNNSRFSTVFDFHHEG
jgi:hypothetical protein